MTDVRRTALALLLVAVAAATAAIISGLLGTVFFAVTIASVFVPYQRFLRRLGLSPRIAGAVSTITVFVGGAAVFLPIAVVLYIRRAQLLALIAALPDRFAIEVAGFAYAVEFGELTALAARYVTRLAIDLARLAPVFAAKAAVFGFVVYALLVRRAQLRRALLAPIPAAHQDIALALNDRTRETLYALYVIQAATAVGTFLVAAPIFALLGYSYPITLAVFAGILQFLPVVGPSVVVLGLAAFEASAGNMGGAALVAGVGIVAIALLPDLVIRPRLAHETADLPASLYFVGFTGGVFSLGPVGVIAGPLAVALLGEVLSLLSDEMGRPGGGDGGDAP